MVFYAAPHRRGLALSGADEDFRAFHAEFIRRLANESSLRTTAKPWFLHQLRVIAHTIEAVAPSAIEQAKHRNESAAGVRSLTPAGVIGLRTERRNS
ncbi:MULTISPECIES: hypothetical protein [unclassified Streptomyces]|uniref:hypothetical protein n=1 Tax=unclassified Streptomyces TaxID=2593676 RepID=UPI000959D8EF|nr:hypothetical protein [Streptomyces sp. TSRI0281]OKI45848.1 hypothetical protein A6A29_30185 [Streptomyces sp. TSRI0281]